jgi:hypothetical protein
MKNSTMNIKSGLIKKDEGTDAETAKSMLQADQLPIVRIKI